MTTPELSQMMQRYEELVRELDNDDEWRPGDTEKIAERVDLFYKLLKYGLTPDTRTEPWSWIAVEPEEED